MTHGLLTENYATSFEIHRTRDVARLDRWASRIAIESGLHSSDTLLDLGCGLGRFTYRLAPKVGAAYGFDANKSMIERASAKDSNITWRNCDFLCSELPPATVVLLSMVLEHLRSPEEGIKAAASSLAPAGRLVIRTMLPQDIEETTWYKYHLEAKKLEMERTPDQNTLEDWSKTEGLELISSSRYRDIVATDIARELPERITMRSFEILSRVDDVSLRAAAEQAASNIAQEDHREFMASTILVFGRK